MRWPPLALLLGLVLATPARAQFTGQSTRASVEAALVGAMRKGDYHQALAIEAEWAAQHPADLDMRRVEPVLYRLAGDMGGWERARKNLLQAWAATRTSGARPGSASFIIDMVRVKQGMMFADQCYERAGRWGVLYRFTVVGADGKVESFFTVENADSDNQVARELGQKDPVFTLDHFRPGIHETVAMLPALPSYDELRQRALAFLADPRPVSASRNGDGGLPTENCAFNPAR